MTDISELAKDVIEKAEKATPRPWHTDKAICTDHETESNAIYYCPRENYIVEVVEDGCTCGKIILSNGDAAYIVAACNAAPELARAVIEQGVMLQRVDDWIAAKDAEIAQLRQVHDLQKGSVDNQEKEILMDNYVPYKDYVALRDVIHELKKALGLA